MGDVRSYHVFHDEKGYMGGISSMIILTQSFCYLLFILRFSWKTQIKLKITSSIKNKCGELTSVDLGLIN